MENYEDIERTIMMAKRFFGTAGFTREKFEQYSEDICGSSFHALYEHDAIVETGEIKIVTRVVTPYEIADMVNEGATSNTDFYKWKWRFDKKTCCFIGIQYLTIYRMV